MLSRKPPKTSSCVLLMAVAVWRQRGAGKAPCTSSGATRVHSIMPPESEPSFGFSSSKAKSSLFGPGGERRSMPPKSSVVVGSGFAGAVDGAASVVIEWPLRFDGGAAPAWSSLGKEEEEEE